MILELDTSRTTPTEARALLALVVTLFPEVMDDADVGLPPRGPADAAADNGYSLGPLNPVGTVAEDDDATPAADVPAGAVDKDGLPWDARIHAASKAVTGDGKWRKRRNLDDATYDAVVAELRGAAPVPTPPAASAPSVPAPVPSSPPLPPAQDAAPAPSPIAIQAENSAPAPAPQPAPVGGEAPDMNAFAAIMKKVSVYQAEGKLTPQEVNETLAQCGLSNPRELVTSSMGRMTFEALIDTIVSGRE